MCDTVAYVRQYSNGVFIRFVDRGHALPLCDGISPYIIFSFEIKRKNFVLVFFDSTQSAIFIKHRRKTEQYTFMESPVAHRRP